MSDRPSIVVIKTDQQRFDTIRAHGYEHVVTPNLDRLTGEGISFSKAFCCGATCISSRAAFYTGMFAHNTGVFHFDPWSHLRTWLHDLRDAGYHVAEVGKVHHAPIDAPMAYHERVCAENFPSMQHWDDYSNFLKASGKENPCKLLVEGADPETYQGFRPFPLEEQYHVDSFVGRMSVRWLEDYRRNKPFFLHVGFVGPHDPYDPPQRFLDMYADRDIPAPIVSGDEFETKPGQYARFMEWHNERLPNFDGSPAHGSNRLCLADMSPDEVLDMRRHYYAKITQIDEQVGRIMDCLEERGLLDNTLVIFTSDHGDNLGDHQMIWKWLMTEQTTRVPMIVRLPGGKRGGTRDDRLFTQMDIGPTLLEFAGVDIPAYLDGKSNLSRLTDGDERSIPDMVFCQDNYLTMVRTEDRRLIHYAGQPYGELYDMETDPGECVNLWDSDEEREERDRIRLEYLEWRATSSYLGSYGRLENPKGKRRKFPAYHPHDPYVLQKAAKPPPGV